METYNFTKEEKFLQAKRKVKSIKGFYVHATIYFLVNLFIIAGCAVDDIQNLINPETYMTALFWGIGLAAHGFSVFGPNVFLGKDWEEKEIQKILNK